MGVGSPQGRVRTTPASSDYTGAFGRAAGAMDPDRSPNPESVPSKSMEYHGGEPPKTMQNDRKIIQKSMDSDGAEPPKTIQNDPKNGLKINGL